MRYLTYSAMEHSSYPLCLLIPQIRKDEIYHAYMAPFGIPEDDIIVMDLHQSVTSKKTPMKEIKQYILEELVPVLTDLAVEVVLVTDSDYFKALTKATKVEAHLGYIMDCVYGSWKVAYVPSHKTIFYDPDKVKTKITQAITAVLDYRIGNYQLPGNSIIHKAIYPSKSEEIEQWLERLIIENRPLSCDIETFSLKHHTAGIGTITFCWSKHEGIAFPVDLGSDPTRIRNALRSFFQRFNQKLFYHNISFDVYVLIYQLFMKDILDTEGMLNGLNILLRNWEDTKLISYLATNSCAGNRLGLKDQSQEFAGNYAMGDGIKDIRSIPLPELLEYNLVDGLATWYVYKKNWPTVIADQQVDIYVNLFKPAIVDIIQMQLTGLPINMKRVSEVRNILETDEAAAVAGIQGSPLVQAFVYKLEEKHIAKRNAMMVKKRIVLGDEPQEFNPNSDPQLQMLLYEFLKLKVIARTKEKQPSTSGDTIKALKNHTQDPLIIALLDFLIVYKGVNKILTSFIPAMENAAEGPDGWHYLFGNFNLGGTVSGRLSSSNPNLQNIPSTGSRYSKIIKSCFQAPPGWLFCGLDFDSLEDKISGLTTKDPEKLKVYTDGYDGHSLRAFAYYREQMPDIIDTVESINSIPIKYAPLRQESKTPTFALTYDGTYKTLMNKCGFSQAKAKSIETRYRELYATSIQWVSDRLDQASRNGYVTAAFGLRVRTPLLKQVIRGTKRTPYEAASEGRSAGNALGQSYCLLNSRAGSEFMGKVRSSRYKLQIRPCAQIHDAQYFLIQDDIDAVMFTNEHLVNAVSWQDDPAIAHPDVNLGGKLSIFYPSWVKNITIPNNASEDEIFSLVQETKA